MTFSKYFILSLVLFASVNLLYAQKNGVKILSPKEFHEIAENDPRAVVIDVSKSKTYKKGHIVYALSAEKSENLFQIIDTTGTDQIYLLYCKYGERSAEAGKMLYKKYKLEVCSLKGGSDLWKKEGYELVR